MKLFRNLTSCSQACLHTAAGLRDPVMLCGAEEGTPGLTQAEGATSLAWRGICLFPSLSLKSPASCPQVEEPTGMEVLTRARTSLFWPWPVLGWLRKLSQEATVKF